MGPKGGTHPNTGVAFKGNVLGNRVVSIISRKGHLVRFRCRKVFRRVLSRLNRVPLPPCVARGLGSGGHCRAICTGGRNSTTTPATKLRFAGRLLRGMGRGNIGVTRIALRMNLKAFHPIGMSSIRDRRVRSRFCVMRRSRTGLVGSAGGTNGHMVTMKAADYEALRSTAKRSKVLGSKDN